jgi:hypothetical protein
MVNSNIGQLGKLEAEIVELEEQIPDREMRQRLLATPKRLFAEAQDYHRKGNEQEARLTINCTCRLLQRAKDELKRYAPRPSELVA